MDEQKRRVLKKLKETGFPLELKVGALLRKNNWEVYPNDPYSDPETQKVRSIDFRAELRKIDKEFELSELKKTIVSASCQLFIECKHGAATWVFYHDKDVFNIIRQVGFHAGGRIAHIKKKGKELRGLDRVTYHHRLLDAKVSFREQVVFGKDNFHGAQMQVLNSIEKSLSIDDFDKHLLYPVIVYDGNIFTCEYGTEMNLEKADHIRYLSGGIPSNSIPTFIDVVSIDFLPQYLVTVRREFIEFSDAKILYSDSMRSLWENLMYQAHDVIVPNLSLWEIEQKVLETALKIGDNAT